MAFDAFGNLYSSNGNFDNGTVSVYAAGTSRLLRRIRGLVSPYALVVDSQGYLYIAGFADDVLEYAPNSTQLSHVIRQGVRACSALAIDATDNLYVANKGNGTVTVYSTASSFGLRKLTKKILGLHHPVALAFGPSGDLFVANERSVSVYKAGSLKLLRTINGITAVTAIAIDSSGTLYVSSTPLNRQGYQPGWVDVYLAGQTKPRRKITDGINSPFDVAVDSQDRLYVSNAYGSTVTVYGLRGKTLLRTIRSGIVSPKFLALSSR